ncbi:MAG TPA: hypothetical protein VL400_20830 [Polyangiaceae bacterium]|nr:hypothetical protein [Polyangiaceae bacterium]
MKRSRFASAMGWLALAALGGCGGHDEIPASPSGSPSAASVTTGLASSEAPSTPHSTDAPSTTTAAPAVSVGPVGADGSFACGPLRCRRFKTATEAFDSILERDRPLILSIGETHAQKGSEGVASTTSRFTTDLLPRLEGRASSLILELWVRDGSCGKKEEKVETQQKEVTKTQSDANPNEFQTLGEKSKALGIVPFILRPTCDEYDKIIKAGDDAVMEMLGMITRNMRDKADKLFVETDKKQKGKMVVTYGGAMHNDLAPRPGREQWSFAKDLDKTASGRFVELDLIVPEFIKDTESWKGLAWYPAYDKATMGSSAVLVEMGPRSYALVFPKTNP